MKYILYFQIRVTFSAVTHSHTPPAHKMQKKPGKCETWRNIHCETNFMPVTGGHLNNYSALFVEVIEQKSSSDLSKIEARLHS